MKEIRNKQEIRLIVFEPTVIHILTLFPLQWNVFLIQYLL
jgi:hypothetical protein